MKKRKDKLPVDQPITNVEATPILHNQLTLIEVAEPEILIELQADRRIGPLIVTNISDRVALIAPGKSEQIVKHLLKAGHTPKIINQ